MLTTEVRNCISKIQDDYNVKVVYLTISGSKLYGTDNEKSDTDYKGIFISDRVDVILKTDRDSIDYSTGDDSSKNNNGDIDISLMSIHKFMNLVKKGETGTLDLLFSMFTQHQENVLLYNDDIMDAIKDNVQDLTNKNIKAFTGYAVSMAKKYNVRGNRYQELSKFLDILLDFPLEEDYKKIDFKQLRSIVDKNKFQHIKFVAAPGPRGNKDEVWEYISVLGKLFSGKIEIDYFIDNVRKIKDGYGSRVQNNSNTKDSTDWKAISHSIRVIYECIEYLQTGKIMFPLKEAKYIKQIKDGIYGIDSVMYLMENLLNQADEAFKVSKINEKSNQYLINKILLECYK